MGRILPGGDPSPIYEGAWRGFPPCERALGGAAAGQRRGMQRGTLTDFRGAGWRRSGARSCGCTKGVPWFETVGSGAVRPFQGWGGLRRV